MLLLNIRTRKWEDEQMGGMARQHLKELSGQEPKRWETNDKFIARVSKPADHKAGFETPPRRLLNQRTCAGNVAPGPVTSVDTNRNIRRASVRP